MKQFGLNKTTKLCGTLRVQQVLRQGEALTAYPLRWKWTWQDPAAEQPHVHVLFWAPKRQFKHAVDRNRLRRLMREAYRMRQEAVCQVAHEKQKDLQLTITYISEELTDLHHVEKAMEKAIRKLKERN